MAEEGTRDPAIVVIGGPTASGKSGLALALAEEFGGTIINADSMQVYRDLRVLTARPGPDEEARVPHRLFGVLDASDACSAARWVALAEGEIAAATAAGRLPILVGGTGLYLRALMGGLAAIPPVPAEIRMAARQLHRELGGAAFHARLAERDPAGAARLAPGDTQRLIRAYEVLAATGRPLGEWQRRGAGGARFKNRAVIVLLPPRAALYAAGDARLAAMVAGGALDEVRSLLARRLDPGLPVMKVLGLRELSRSLAGEIALPEAMRLAQQATRNYAKRQVTWFRHQMPEARQIFEQFSERILPDIFSFIRRCLLTPHDPPFRVAPPS